MKNKTKVWAVVLLFGGMLAFAGLKEGASWLSENAKLHAAEVKEQEAAEAKHRKAITDTTSLVKQTVELYGAKKTNMGAYIRPGDEKETVFEMKDKDSWDKPIRLIYTRGPIQEGLLARSAGPDGKFNTEDDITDETYSTNGVGAGTAVKEAAGDLFQGAYDKIRGRSKK
jgi:hypothetical protein